MFFPVTISSDFHFHCGDLDSRKMNNRGRKSYGYGYSYGDASSSSPAVGTNNRNSNRINSNNITADIEAAPKHWPFLPALSLFLVLAFLSLQFLLTPTHYRHPFDPTRTWIPILKSPPPSPKGEANLVTNFEDVIGGNLSNDGSTEIFIGKKEHLEIMNLFSSTDDLDIRPLAVIVNSTLSLSQSKKNIHFHFTVPGEISETGIHMLKSLFKEANIEMISNEAMVEKMKSLMAFKRVKEATKQIPRLEDFIPFYLPQMYPSITRFVYVDSNVLLMSDIKELFELDLGDYAMAATEDCTHKFDEYFDFELLESILNSNETGKPLLPKQKYSHTMCSFDQGVLLIDANKWTQKKMTENIEWWIEENLKNKQSLYRNDLFEPPVLLSLYENYQNLDAVWNTREPLVRRRVDSAKLIRFNRRNKPWLRPKPKQLSGDAAGLWWTFLSDLANQLIAS